MSGMILITYGIWLLISRPFLTTPVLIIRVVLMFDWRELK